LNTDCSHEIEFIVSHSDEIDIYGFETIDRMILSGLLLSKELKNKNKDWCYEIILRLIRVGHNIVRMRGGPSAANLGEGDVGIKFLEKNHQENQDLHCNGRQTR
jgi:hypothetical protein